MSQKAGGDEQWLTDVCRFTCSKRMKYTKSPEMLFQFFAENALGGKRALHGIGRMELEVVEMALDLFQAPEGGGGMTQVDQKHLHGRARLPRMGALGEGAAGLFNIVAAEALIQRSIRRALGWTSRSNGFRCVTIFAPIRSHGGGNQLR